MRQLHRAVVCGALIAAASAAPALADSPLEPLTFGVGLQTPTTTTFTSGVTSLDDFTVSYDVTPRTIVPIRAALEANYQSDSGGRRQTAFGGGLTVRSTTPLYVGAGFGVYSISYEEGVSTPLLVGGSPPTVRLTDTQVAPEVFIGQRIFSGPGVAVALQATYRIFPATTFGSASIGEYPSNVGLGLRVRL